MHLGKKVGHKWTDKECIVVCEVFKRDFVDSSSSLVNAISSIMKECPDLENGSVRMKISNTVQLCKEFSIRHTCQISTLKNYSQQHLKAFKKVFEI